MKLYDFFLIILWFLVSIFQDPKNDRNAIAWTDVKRQIEKFDLFENQLEKKKID